MDGWMDGRMDGWMDGRMDGWMDSNSVVACIVGGKNSGSTSALL